MNKNVTAIQRIKFTFILGFFQFKAIIFAAKKIKSINLSFDLKKIINKIMKFFLYYLSDKKNKKFKNVSFFLKIKNELKRLNYQINLNARACFPITST